MTHSSNPRNHRNQRPSHPRPMRETERDRQIVEWVYAYRILSQAQLERLLRRSQSTVQRILMRLYHHQYLDRQFMPVAYAGSSPTLYMLGKRGIALLQRQGFEDFSGLPAKNLSGLFLEHTLAINDFRITINEAVERLGWQVPVWQIETDLKADYDKVVVRTHNNVETVSLIPDSYFVIEIPERGVAHFFLELDRGTMTLKRFRMKVAAYVAYQQTGAFQKRYAAQRFRVLAVVDTPSPARALNLAQDATAVPGIGRSFWFAHADLSPPAVLNEPVWIVAGQKDFSALFS